MISTGTDILIVGAGSAGCVLAARLSEDPSVRVMLVEAGEEPSDPRIQDPAAWALLQGSEVDWQFTTQPQSNMAHRAHPWPRGKVVGGSSAIHAMGHMRGHPDDFDAWARAGAIGWDHAALLPWFCQSETSPFADDPGYGGDGPVHLMQPAQPHPLTQAHRAAGQSLGLVPIRDHNGPHMHGPTLNTLTIKGNKRQSVADAYLTPAVRARANLHLHTGMTLDRVKIEQNRAVGLYALRDDTEITLTASRVILAAGAIGTPTILMRSGLGPATILKDLGIPLLFDRPQIGANLQDHLLGAGNVYAARHPIAMSSTQHSESLTYIHAEGQNEKEAPELVVGIVTVPVISEAFPETRPEFGTAYTLMFGVTHPRSRGHLTLTSADPKAKPKIDPCYLSASEDRRHMSQALDWARKIGHAPAFDGFRAKEILPRAGHLRTAAARDAFIQAAAYTHHHPVGTCRMGADPTAPVSPDLSVKGIAALSVVDGSVLPSLTTGPVNAAIVAVAERAADMLRRRFSTSRNP